MSDRKIKVLFLAAYPDVEPLMLDEEIRSITQKIRVADYRDCIELVSAWAVRPDDLLQTLNQHKPDIVHFSGHGKSSGEIVLVDLENGKRIPKPVNPAALKALFEVLKDNIRVVLLNACYSQIQAEAIKDVIDCVIGMNADISDQAAIIFASSFYRAIGFGRSVREAFEQGRTALLLEGITEDKVPKLLCRKGVNPSKLHLLTNDDRSIKIINADVTLTYQELGVKFDFPVVDFKFQNRSDIAAFLWKFELEILHIEIDSTPVLSLYQDDESFERKFVGRLCVEIGDLVIKIVNNGWGAAKDLRVELTHWILDKIFPKSSREFRFHSIESGGSGVCVLDKGSIDTKAVQALFSDPKCAGFGVDEKYIMWKNLANEKGDIVWEKLVSGIKCSKDFCRIYGIEARLSYVDERGLQYNEKVKVPAGIFLTRNGDFFEAEEHIIPPCLVEAGFHSDMMYCTLVNVSQGKYKRVYNISRRIPPRDLDRFHVMIACEKSCYLKSRFIFYIDDLVIKSKTFNIHIWNPRNKGLHEGYQDGRVISFDETLGSHGYLRLHVIEGNDSTATDGE